MTCESCKEEIRLLKKQISSLNTSIGYYKRTIPDYQRTISELEEKLKSETHALKKLRNPIEKIRYQNHLIDSNIRKRKKQINIERELLNGTDTGNAGETEVRSSVKND